MPSCWTSLLVCKKSRKDTRRSTNTIGVQAQVSMDLAEHSLPSLRITTERASMGTKSISLVALSKKKSQNTMPTPAQEPLSFNSSSFSSISKNSSFQFFKPERQCPSVFSAWSNPEQPPPINQFRRSGIVWPECLLPINKADPFIVPLNARWPKLKPVTPASKTRSLIRTRSRPAALHEGL